MTPAPLCRACGIFPGRRQTVFPLGLNRIKRHCGISDGLRRLSLALWRRTVPPCVAAPARRQAERS